jgi:cysteinyl-tRNA synthetase
MFELVRQANIALSEGNLAEDDRKGILDFFAVLDDRLAIVPPLEDAVHSDQEQIEALIAQRNQARRNRDFALSDKLRDELLRLGVVIEDTKEGTRWRRK